MRMKHRNARLCQSLSRPCGRRAWFSSLAELAAEGDRDGREAATCSMGQRGQDPSVYVLLYKLASVRG